MRSLIRRRLVWVAGVILSAGALGSCVIGSNDDADVPPTVQLDPSQTFTAAPGPSATLSPTTTSTASPTATPSPTTVPPTPSPTPRPTASATPIPKAPLGEIAPLDPVVIVNFSLAAQIELRGVPNQSDFSMTLAIQQSAPDHYYLRSTSGSSVLESWLVDGTTYLTQADGGVAPLPAGSDTALFSPALLVQTIPVITGETLGTRLGNETVGGRDATRYRVDGEDLFQTATWLPGDTAIDIDGQVDVWIDSELRIVLRQESDVTWGNDGAEGSFVGRLEVTNISTTVPVNAPG